MYLGTLAAAVGFGFGNILILLVVIVTSSSISKLSMFVIACREYVKKKKMNWK